MNITQMIVSLLIGIILGMVMTMVLAVLAEHAGAEDRRRERAEMEALLHGTRQIIDKNNEAITEADGEPQEELWKS